MHLGRKLGGPQTSLNAVAKNKYPCPYREQNPGRPARSPVTTLTELSRLPNGTWPISKVPDQ